MMQPLGNPLQLDLASGLVHSFRRRKWMLPDKRNRNKKFVLAIGLTCIVALLSPHRLRSNDNDDDKIQRSPVLTDPIVGTWNCVIPAAGGFPEVRVIKSMQVGGTAVEIDNAAPPSQETP